MLRKKTPIGKLEEQPNIHPAQEKEVSTLRLGRLEDQGDQSQPDMVIGRERDESQTFDPICDNLGSVGESWIFSTCG